jgi:hypothetical protein
MDNAMIETRWLSALRSWLRRGVASAASKPASAFSQLGNASDTTKHQRRGDQFRAPGRDSQR